jgi:GNAT superfamily N-acetyltransferase
LDVERPCPSTIYFEKIGLTPRCDGPSTLLVAPKECATFSSKCWVAELERKVRKMKIRLAEKSETEAISRFVSKLAVTHIGSTLQVGGLEKLLRGMDVDSTITRMSEGFPHWVALEGGAIVGIAVVKPPSHIYQLFVRSDRQRSGIGRRLMNQALRFISDSWSQPPTQRIRDKLRIMNQTMLGLSGGSWA